MCIVCLLSSLKGDVILDGLGYCFTNLHVLSFSLKIALISPQLMEYTNKAAKWPIIS